VGRRCIARFGGNRTTPGAGVRSTTGSRIAATNGGDRGPWSSIRPARLHVAADLAFDHVASAPESAVVDDVAPAAAPARLAASRARTSGLPDAPCPSIVARTRTGSVTSSIARRP
jgi:hypothetical protein